jgi:hypothetical protein
MRHIEVGQEFVNGKTAQEMPLPPVGVVASRVYPHLYNAIVEDPAPLLGRFADKKIIMLRRDPRDVAVSLYYSVRYSHTTKTRDPEAFKNKRAILEAMGIVEGIMKHTAETAMSQFIATFDFLQKYPHACLTTYETLTMDFPSWSRQVREYMQWSDEESHAVFDGLDANVAPPETIDPFQHKRRVTPGNWREVFDDQLINLFEKRIGTELAKAGYVW